MPSGLKKILIALAVVGFCLPLVMGIARLFHGNPLRKGWEAISSSTHRVQARVHELASLHEEVERLRLENAHWKLQVESSQFECQAKSAQTRTQDLGKKLAESAGSKVARTIASIDYKPPTHLEPKELLALGTAYFSKREDEKAAMIFSLLLEQEAPNPWRTPKNMMMAAVTWYRLDHDRQADAYFDEVIKAPDQADNLPFKAQARLWKGLVAKRHGKPIKAQYWLKELLEFHPHSIETTWVNASGEGAHHAHSHE